MSPKVLQVEPLDHYQLRLFFDNNEVRIFDVMPYLDKGIFTELKSVQYFQSVKSVFGGVQWPNEQDFSRDTLYLLSQLERSQPPIDYREQAGIN
ncbi:MAG: DUF2442 domain-containing protein [Alkalinema sp. CAN_BIN05]|nr:DUF2442 domain-containing protein [Alkalinema sp. CAN_BIN05]